ncbi:MAG: hypothetical protein AAGJ82_13540 [Bacteroidota bacterium]
MAKIVYLEARGNGSFRSKLRSDTLWGMLCWTLRKLEGDNFDFATFFESYTSDTVAGNFYLSSAYPWVETADGKRTHFLPNPLDQPPLKDEPSTGSPRAIKAAFRRRKQTDKRKKGFLSWEQFDYSYGSGNEPALAAWQEGVALRTQAVTHNQIDRRRLGTFTENDNGQLFHMNENYYDFGGVAAVKKHGLYFLLSGDTPRAEAALRLLDTTGFGGDSSIGKGSFQVDIHPDAHQLEGQFSLPKLTDNEANARLNLALYCPKNAVELQDFDGQTDPRFWQYKLETRQGRNVQSSSVLQDEKLLFSEGSIFPKVNSNHHPGTNWLAGKHSRLGHDIYRYGHAFLLNIKLS